MKKYANVDEQAVHQNLMKTRLLKRSIDVLKSIVDDNIKNNKSARVLEFALKINNHLNDIYKIMDDLTEFTYEPGEIFKPDKENDNRYFQAGNVIKYFLYECLNDEDKNKKMFLFTIEGFTGGYVVCRSLNSDTRGELSIFEKELFNVKIDVEIYPDCNNMEYVFENFKG